MSDVQNIVIGQKTSSTMIALARELRGRMTSEEKILWEQLRAKRLAGFRFRRQQVVAKYVVDFYCHATALVVEVDGPSHNRQRERDAERDAELSGLGLWILRFSNEDIRRNLSKVVGEIAAACRDRSGPLP